MRIGLKDVVVGIAAAALAVFLWSRVPPVAGQGEPYRAPRTADGRPDLSGVWQALNTANYDLQAHPARPALAVIPAPPRTAAPGLGRSQPVELPAEGSTRARRSRRRSRRRKRRRRQRDSLPAVGAGAEKGKRRALARARIQKSGASCRVCRAPPTCRTSFRSFRAPMPFSSGTTRRDDPHDSFERGKEQSRTNMDGAVARALGGRDARRRRHRLQRPDMVRSRREFP